MIRSLFPRRTDMAAVGDEARVTQLERSEHTKVSTSALRMRYRHSAFEQAHDIGHLGYAGPTHDFLDYQVNTSQSLVETRAATPEDSETNGGIGSRYEIVIPYEIKRPSGQTDVAGINMFYSYTDDRAPAVVGEHFAKFGTVFVINPENYTLEEHHTIDGGDKALNFYSAVGSPIYTGKHYSLAVLLTKSPVVIVNGRAMKNPFFEGNYSNNRSVPRHNLLDKCRPVLEFLQRSGEDGGEWDGDFSMALHAIARAMPKILAARAEYEKQQQLDAIRVPSRGEVLSKVFSGLLAQMPFSRREKAAPHKEGSPVTLYNGKVITIPHDLPLPPATLEKYVEEAIPTMPEEVRETAQAIWKNLKPLPAGDILKLPSHFAESNLDVLKQMPMNDLYRFFKAMSNVGYITPAAAQELRSKFLEQRPDRITSFEYEMNQIIIRMFSRYEKNLRFFAKSFGIWLEQERACAAEDFGEFAVADTQSLELSTDRRRLLYSDPRYYLEVLDALAAWGTERAAKILETHRAELPPEIDKETLAKVDQSIAACRKN